jgi:hypothetical protein
MAGSALPALAGSQTKPYYVPAGESQEDAYTQIGGQPSPLVCNSANPGALEACFHVSGSGVNVEIVDKSGQPTPSRIWFYDDGGNRTGPDPVLLCGSGHVDLPDGTTQIDVRIGPLGREGSTTPPAAQVPCGKPSPATTGTVTVSGSGVDGVAGATPVRVLSEPGQAAVRTMHRTITKHFAAAAVVARGKFIEL